jgi:hypothetical protein
MAALVSRGRELRHPQDTLESCLNCSSESLYGAVCARCGLCQKCDEFLADDCYCESPTASQRFDAAMGQDW